MATETTSPLVSSNDRLRIFLHALLFVFGFSLVFVVGWGGSVTALGQLFGAYKRVIAQIGGVIVIMFGLATLEVISRSLVLCGYARPIHGSTRDLWRLGVDGHFLRRRLEPVYRRNARRDTDNGTQPADRWTSHVAGIGIFTWIGNSVSRDGTGT